MQRHRVTSFETERSLANDPSGGGLRRNSSGIVESLISLLFIVALEESVSGAFNGGENSIHWKANMLPLFGIMTL